MSSSCPACSEPVEPGHDSCPHCGEPPGEPGAEPLQPATSRGVTAFGVVNLSVGVLGGLLSVGLVLLGFALRGGGGRGDDALAVLSFVLGVGCLVGVTPCLVLGLGLLRRRSWARTWVLVFSAVWVVCSAGGLLFTLTYGYSYSSGLAVVAVGLLLALAYSAGQGFVLLRARDEFSQPPDPTT